MKVKSEREVAQSCPTLRDPMDCSLPGSSIHGIFPGKTTGVGCHCLLHFHKRQCTPVFLPGESQGRGSLLGCRLCSHAESDMTEATKQQQQCIYYIKSMGRIFLSFLFIIFLCLFEEVRYRTLGSIRILISFKLLS